MSVALCCGGAWTRIAAGVRNHPFHRWDGSTARLLWKAPGRLERWFRAGCLGVDCSVSRSVESRLPLRSSVSSFRFAPITRASALRRASSWRVRCSSVDRQASSWTLRWLPAYSRAIERATGPPRDPLCSSSREPLPSPYLNAHVKAYILDETLIKQSAVHYTTDLPASLFNDVNARATSRLYSSPHRAVVRARRRRCGGTYRLGRSTRCYSLAPRCLSICLLASCSRPVDTASRSSRSWQSSLPWVVLSSAMFTESLAYPLFLWAVYALARLYVKPSPGRDVFAIVAICARDGRENSTDSTRIAYFVIVVLRRAHDLRTPGVPWYVALDRLVVRRMPGRSYLPRHGLGVFWLSRAGNLTTHLNSLLGTYASTTTDQHALPRDIGLSTGVELIGLAAGTGVLPVVAGFSWLVIRRSRRLVRGHGRRSPSLE